MSLCKSVSDLDFEQRVLENHRPVLVEFWAPWCGPCQMVAGVLDKIAEEFADEVDVVKMNIDTNPEIPQKLQVRSIPNMMLFKKGELIGHLVGMPDPNHIVELLETALDEDTE